MSSSYTYDLGVYDGKSANPLIQAHSYSIILKLMNGLFEYYTLHEYTPSKRTFTKRNKVLQNSTAKWTMFIATSKDKAKT